MLHRVLDVAYDENICRPIRTRKCRSTNWLVNYMLLSLSFAFLFDLLFSLSLTLIISIFYCLSNTLLLLHLITTHLVWHLSLHLLFSLYLTLIIGIFHCLNYISLLLHLIITHLVNTFYNEYEISKWPRQLIWFI